MSDREAHVHTAQGKFGQRISVGPHELGADEPVDLGGDDRGPSPHELLLSALGACTSMTVKMYADRKGWPVTAVDVKLSHEKSKRPMADGGPEQSVTVLRRRVHLEGDLTDEQRTRLLEIANKCPVHKTLTGSIEIPTELV